MWVDIEVLSKRPKQWSLISSYKRYLSNTVVKPLHFLRAKEGSLILKLIPFHNDVYLAMYNS